LARAIQKFVEDPLAEEIVKGLAHPGDTIHFSVEDQAEKLILKIDKGQTADATEAPAAPKSGAKKEGGPADAEPQAEAATEEDLEGK
jgi:hypothetical protein